MEPQTQLEELLKLAEHLGIEVYLEPLGEQPGGLCCLKGRWRLYINEDAPLAERIQTAVDALAGRPQLEDCFMLPLIRRLLQRPADKGGVP